MSYELTNTPLAIRLIKEGTTRMFLKKNIREISLVKGSIVSIELGDGKRIFIPFHEISVPALNNASELVTELNQYTGSNELEQYQQVAQLLQTQIDILPTLQSSGDGSNDGGTQLILRNVDDIHPDVKYYGYCPPTNHFMDDTQMSIEQVRVQDGITYHAWADGMRLGFTHNWDDREGYGYV